MSSTTLAQLLERLEALERRIALLEAAATAAGAAPEASNADAFHPPARSPAEPEHAIVAAAQQVLVAADEVSTLRDPVRSDDAPTERLHRMPDPFPDLSLLDEKLEPRKGPAERLQVRAAIEDYPRIANRLQQLWGTPDCEAYLNTLVIDTRGNRQGFPPPVLEELLYLSRLARALVILQIDGDLWDHYDHVGDRR